MAQPKFNIADLVGQLQGGGDLSAGAPPTPIGGPPMGAPMGAAALPPAGGLPPLPPARPKGSKGKSKSKKSKGKGGGY